MAKQMSESAKSGRLVAPTVAKAHRAATIKKATSTVKTKATSTSVGGRTQPAKHK